MSPVRRIACVLLPFAAGYYLSFLFRSINALIASDLTADLGLNAADLGLLTSMYFMVFAAVQLPCGVLIDRYSGFAPHRSAGCSRYLGADWRPRV